MKKDRNFISEKEVRALKNLYNHIEWLIKESIYNARDKKGYTQEKLAEEISHEPIFNFSAKTMEAYENYGKSGRMPPAIKFLYIAALMDIDLNEIRDEIKKKIKSLSIHNL